MLKNMDQYKGIATSEPGLSIAAPGPIFGGSKPAGCGNRPTMLLPALLWVAPLPREYGVLCNLPFLCFEHMLVCSSPLMPIFLCIH